MSTTYTDDPRIIEFDVRTDEMLVNMGPQHPSTHGVLRLVLRTDGEVVSEVTPHIGYLHRCAEKIGENLTPRQWIPYTDRMDYLAGMNMNLGWALTVEKLMKLELPEKAKHLRVLIAEMGRHRQPSGRHGGVWARPRHVQPVPLRLPRTRKDPRPVRGGLRRAAHLQLYHRRRGDGRSAVAAGCKSARPFSTSSSRLSPNITPCSRPTRSSSAARRESASSRRKWRSITAAPARCSAAAASIKTSAATAKSVIRRCTTAMPSR